jgi:hypothetical protein
VIISTQTLRTVVPPTPRESIESPDYDDLGQRPIALGHQIAEGELRNASRKQPSSQPTRARPTAHEPPSRPVQLKIPSDALATHFNTPACNLYLQPFPSP